SVRQNDHQRGKERFVLGVSGSSIARSAGTGACAHLGGCRRTRAEIVGGAWLADSGLNDFTATPEQYRTYLQQSRGEFSCAKPSCMQLQNAWISDRTICYLASGKPAIVQHTGPSRFLPDAEGLFRFRNLNEAVRVISLVEADYERQCRAARALAEAHFD